jgi:hypothetical protein
MERISRQTHMFDGQAALWAGLIGGTVFLLSELLMVPALGGGSLYGPLRMMAAIVFGPSVLAADTFNIGVLGTALVVHYFLSLFYALIFALCVHRLEAGGAAIAGLIGGFLLYLVNFYGFTALFPWFVAARNGITIFNHLIFGLTTVLFYIAIRRAHHEETGENTPLIHRHA